MSWSRCFNHEGVGRLEEAERAEKLRMFQAYSGLRNHGTAREWEADEAAGRHPKTAEEALRTLRGVLSPCTWRLPRMTPAECVEEERRLRTGAPVKRRMSESEATDGRGGGAKAEVRWRLRQKVLMNRLAEEARVGGLSLASMRLDNERNEAKAARATSEDVDELLREMAASDPHRHLYCRYDAELTDEEARDIDLACYETLRDDGGSVSSNARSNGTGSTADDPVLIVDSGDEEERGTGVWGTETMDAEEEELLRDAVWYETRPRELEKLWREAESKRGRLARVMKAAHKAVVSQRLAMVKANGGDAVAKGGWSFRAACEREDRLRALQARLTERRRQYARAATEADGLRAVWDMKRERCDYDPAAERRAALVDAARHQ